jgi:molecular chaperone DnaK
LIKDLRDAVQTEDEGRMRSLSEELQQAMYQVSQNAYSQEQPAGAPKNDGDEGVVEGEYTVE